MKAPINDSYVKKLQPPTDSRYVLVWDTKTPSFGICVTAGGVKTFLLDYYVDRRHRRVKLGRYPALSVQAARDKAVKWQGKVIDRKSVM